MKNFKTNQILKPITTKQKQHNKRMTARRNSTSFPKENYEFLKRIAVDKKDPLRYHQRLVYEYVIKTPWVRGLLINFKMGAGKSIMGVSICEGLLASDTNLKVIFIASKSLHNNFYDAILQYRKMMAESSATPFAEADVKSHIDSHYQFISLNASNMLTQVHRAIKKDAELDAYDEGVFTAEDAEEFAKLEQIGNLDDTIVVVDEAHNFFNSISNGSKNAVGLYQLIMKAKNSKVIFLTGSPIVNDPFELAIAMNMIAGPLRGGYTLFGEDYMDFIKYFVGSESDTDDPAAPSKSIILKNRDKFINRIVGLVSYYGADDPEQRKLYPEQLPIVVERVPMSGKQYASYITARDREIEETQRGARFSNTARKPLQKPQGMSSSYRVRSRQISNFLYPNYASHSYKDSRGFLRYEKYIDKLDNANLTLNSKISSKEKTKPTKDSKGESKSAKDTEDELKLGLNVWSPKILKLLQNIQKHCPFKFLDSIELPSKPSKTGKGELLEVESRPIEETDWKQIEKIHNKSFVDKYDSPIKGATGFVAYIPSTNRIVAYIIVEPLTEPHQLKSHINKAPDAQKTKASEAHLAKGYIKYVRTIPEFQKRGIATLLMTTAYDKFDVLSVKLRKDHLVEDGYNKYLSHGFKNVGETDTHIILELSKNNRDATGGMDERAVEVKIMDRKNIPEAIELYKKIYQEVPPIDFTDSEVKVYLFGYKDGSEKSADFHAIGIIKPGYASINKQRESANYLVALGTLSTSDTDKVSDLKELLAIIQKDYPKIYLKLDRKIPESGYMKSFYEDREFYVYRESDGFWYLRHIMGAKDKSKTKKPQSTSPKSTQSTSPKSTRKPGIGPGLIYSQFIDSGVKLVGKILMAHGFAEITDINDVLKRKEKGGAAFAIISGEVDPDLRSEIIKIFNSPENSRGEIITVLLVTSTGAEGLDLKNIRHIHVLEPYWHWARIAQVLARGVRMGSHMSLPESERNVQPYIYLSDYPPADVINNLGDDEHIRKQMEKEDTTDVTLYTKCINNQKLIDSFYEAIQEASIDCAIHYKDRNCRMCAPTDEPLFIDDIDKDIRTPSRCQPLQEKSVIAKSITVGDKEFMYSIDSNRSTAQQIKPQNIHIFEYIPKLDGYDEIFENHPLYDELYNAILKKGK